MTAQDIRMTWSSIFKRRGGDGVPTMLFNDLVDAVQGNAVRSVPLEEGELPVVGSLSADAQWFLLTTKRLFVAGGSATRGINVDSIASVSPAEFGKAGKTEMTVLAITTRSGERVDLCVEPGPPFFGMWNVLRNIVARNNHPQVG